MPKLRKENAAVYLDQRCRGAFDARSLLRCNLKMFRHIALQESNDFINVWTKTSKSTICYEGGRIYFDNFQSCYSSRPSQPQLLYSLPKRSKAEKIEDALLCQSPLDKSLATPSAQTPSVLVLTANNWLYRLSADTGQPLQKVYLSPNYKFRYLCWDVPQETFYIKSIQNKVTPSSRQAGINQTTLMWLAVFHVFPLKVVAVLEINKNIFGNTVIDVIVSEGVLAVSHSNKMVKLYSFEHIVQKFRTRELVLGELCDVAGKTIGEAPFGIPVNIHINECPPVLFEVSCSDNRFQIGGYPWHCIFTPPQKKHQGTHHICSLKDSTVANNGIQDMKCCSLQCDWIYFHPDDSGRIVHAGPSSINVLKILNEMESDSQSDVVREFSITALRDNNAASQVSVTSSGRTVKRRYDQLDDDPEQETIQMVEYEDELDLLVVVEATNREGDDGKAHVRLHDNQSGLQLKKIALEESWDVTYRHELSFDRDTIVHIEQMKNNNFRCHVYKMRSNGGIVQLE